MTDTKFEKTARQSRLTLLTVTYGGLIMLAAVLSNKQLPIGPFAADAGQLAYAGVLAILALVTQTMGPAYAKTLIRSGFFLLTLCAILILLATYLPTSPLMEADRIEAFEMLMGQSPRIIAAGMVTYFTVTTLNVWLLRAFDRTLVGRDYAVVASNIASQALDSVMFALLAFGGVFPLGPLIMGQFIVKIALGLTLVPMIVRLGRKLMEGEENVRSDP